MNGVATLDPIQAGQETSTALAKAMAVLTTAKAVAIKTDEDYRSADECVASIKSAQKAAEARRVAIVKPANDFVKHINAGFKPVDAAFEEALSLYRRPMSAYQAFLADQRRAAEEAARKEREAAEAVARAKAAAEMEAARKEREAADAALLAIPADDDFARILAEEEAAAAEVRAAQHTVEAQQVIRDFRMNEAIAPEVAKLTGSASKTYTVWDFEITDASLVPLEYRPIDRTLIARDVKSEKVDCFIPGVRVFSRIEVK